MKYFVFYEDGWAEDGDVGINVFDSEDEAVLYIEKRMGCDISRRIDQYKLIRGEIIDLEPVEIVTKIRAKS